LVFLFYFVEYHCLNLLKEIVTHYHQLLQFYCFLKLSKLEKKKKKKKKRKEKKNHFRNEQSNPNILKKKK